MNLGEIIDDSIISKKHKTYKHFDDYFNNPVLYKIKNIQNYSMYIVPIRNMISESRYLIVFVRGDKHPIGHKNNLSNMEWISLQTNIIKNTKYSLPYHSYTPSLNTPLNTPIHLTKMTPDSYDYHCSTYGLNLSLILDDKNKHYVHNGNLVNAIETYRTIFTWS